VPGGKQPPDQVAPSPGEITGWHEPPVEEGSSRPVIVEEWFTPEGTTDEQPATPSETAPQEAQPPATRREELPGATPAQTGAWYTPLDAQLDALLSGAADTIAEVHEPKSGKPVSPKAQGRLSGDAQAQPGAPTSTAPQGQPAAGTQPEPAAETQAQPADTQPQPATSEGWLAPQAATAEGGPSGSESIPGENQEETRVLTPGATAVEEAGGAETIVEEPAAAESTPVPKPRCWPNNAAHPSRSPLPSRNLPRHPRKARPARLFRPPLHSRNRHRSNR
jgi:hypothetical protein